MEAQENSPRDEVDLRGRGERMQCWTVGWEGSARNLREVPRRNLRLAEVPRGTFVSRRFPSFVSRILLLLEEHGGEGRRGGGEGVRPRCPGRGGVASVARGWGAS